MSILTSNKNIPTSLAVCTLPLIIGLSSTVLAVESSDTLEEVVVSATLLPTQYEKIGNSLTIIDSQQIEDGGYTYLPDVLRQVPGLAISRTGSYGGFTQVRTRGAEGNHTVVMFNGVDVSDASAGETDLSTLLAVNVDRIEVLRGPQSGLYGSNALAGVVNILTRKETNGGYYNGSVEYGSFNTTTVLGGGGTGNDRFYVDGGIGVLHTDGFDTSKLGAINGAPAIDGDREGNRNATGYVSAGVKATSNLRFDGFVRYVDSKAETDGFDFSFVPGQQGMTYDDASVVTTKTYNLAGSGTLSLLDDSWVTVASASYTHSHAEGEDGTPGGQYGDKAYRSKYGLQSSIKTGSNNVVNTFSGFAENKKEWYENTHPYAPTQVAQDRILVGFGVQDQLELAKQLYLSGTWRHDNNDKFKDVDTYSTALSWVVKPAGLRAHASYGKGVTNPSFYEQFGYDPGNFIGNPNLKPEHAVGWDLGLEQTFADGRGMIDLTYFRSILRDEIVSCYPSSCNEDERSIRKGLEFTLRLAPTKNIDIIASYTNLTAKEGKPETVEVRRPKNQAALDTSWRSLADKLRLTLGATFNGEQYDTDYRQYGLPNYVALKTRMPSYTLVRLEGGYKVLPQLEVFARVENLLDRDYEEVLGYQTAGTTAYVGVRFTGGKAKK